MAVKQSRPVLDAGILSVLTLPFLSRLLKSSQSGPIPDDDIPVFAEIHRSATLYPQPLPYLEKINPSCQKSLNQKAIVFGLSPASRILGNISFWAIAGLSILVAAKLLGPLLAQQFILLLTPGGDP